MVRRYAFLGHIICKAVTKDSSCLDACTIHRPAVTAKGWSAALEKCMRSRFVMARVLAKCCGKMSVGRHLFFFFCYCELRGEVYRHVHAC
jgi:hypothetical protein